MYSINVNMGEKTVLTKATSKSGSLRTTVPSHIVKTCGLEEKDLLEWDIQPISIDMSGHIFDSSLTLIVKPLDKEGKRKKFYGVKFK